MRIKGNKYSGRGEVRLDLLPKAKINLYGYFEGGPVQDESASPEFKDGTFFSIDGHQIEGFPISHDVCMENVIWRPKSEPILGVVGDESTQMSQLTFHLFNFVDFNGTWHTWEQSGTMKQLIHHIDLVSDEWKIELKSLISTQENFKILKEVGGYQLTHIGGIQRSGGAPFSGKEAYACLKALRFFLSFVKGGWCEPVCAVGFDGTGNRVWECWSAPREPWCELISWFDCYSGDQMAALFPCFIKKWANDDWAETLHEVIWWYMIANDSSRGIDAGIILTQAAIERLSYEYVVKEKQLLTKNKFNKLAASEKFCSLFSSVGLPSDIPKATPKLCQYAKKIKDKKIKAEEEIKAEGIKCASAPHVLTKIRNSLVHPENKLRRQFVEVYYEAWNLYLWYLEMSVLAVCGYSGTYLNRLKLQCYRSEDVPWKK